jgi:6-phosphogluconolactonase/glucosamine-6-phosphate isomerase/deaminase
LYSALNFATHVQSYLRQRVDWRDVELVLVDEFCVSHSARNHRHLLNEALKNKRHEKVDEMNVAKNVSVHCTAKLLNKIVRADECIDICK